MKKSQKTLLTAAILTAAVGFSGCDGGVQMVYGPPNDIPDSESSASSQFDPSEDQFQPEYGAMEAFPTEEASDSSSENFEPSKQEMQDVYGPPPDEKISDESSVEPYDPALDMVVVEYGPPPDLG